MKRNAYFQRNRKLSAHLAIAACLILCVGVAFSQDSPGVPLDGLRSAGIKGFQAIPPVATDLMTKRLGRIRSGWAVPVQPNQEIEFTLSSAPQQSSPFWTPARGDGGSLEWGEKVEWSLPGGTLQRSSTGVYRLRLPGEPGNYSFSLTTSMAIRDGASDLTAPSGRTVQCTFLVKAPFDRQGNGMLGSYPIGIYPNESDLRSPAAVRSRSELYQPPRSFIRITPEVEAMPVSDHFRLGDFIPRSESGKPHYIALSPRLIEFLEAALDSMQSLFGEASSGRPLVVLTAFLSPTHLSQLRTQGVRLVEFNRYQYGDGAAVIWDADGDGVMDDLNGDGTITGADATVLADQFVKVQRALGKFGGIFVRPARVIPDSPETPCVSIDMRGVSLR